jgi:lipopolysaccharide export system permease protein
MGLKKIDRLVLSSMIPPFVVSFFVALFVLMMQFLWLWIDDIIGKGIDILIILELLGYLLVYLVPTSIPIAVLISGVMVFGNMAEHHELSALKSAGVSLMRSMRIAIIFSLLCGVLTYVSADFLVPIANLKYRTRLFDIKKQKPALNISPGIFNYDFQGYTIYVKGKSSNNRDIQDVLIYDYSTSSPYNVNMITAAEGEMFPSENNRYLIMKLYNGFQIQETQARNKENTEMTRFIRSSFSTYTKKFDLSEFEVSRSEEDLFKSHQDMMNSAAIYKTIDTLSKELEDHEINLFKDFRRDLAYGLSSKSDSAYTESRKRIDTNLNPHTDDIYILPIKDYNAEMFIDQFTSENIQKLFNLALHKVQDAKTRVQITSGTTLFIKENIAKHYFSWHNKYSNGAICIVFLLIGASLGAIVRKGGYGYPLLIAIVFFMIFISLFTTYKKLAETLTTPPIFAAWAPVIYLIPVAIVTLYMAQYDVRISFIKLKRLFLPFKKEA